MVDEAGTLSCSYCGKASIASVGETRLCVHCYHTLQVARTLEFRLDAIGLNYALDEMDYVAPFALGGPRMQVPPIPEGPIILNNIKVDNSVVGSINTGNVHKIDVSLTQLHNAGDDRARDALKNLTEAIITDKTLTEVKKNELIEQVAFLSEQTIVAASERKPGIIKAILSDLTQVAGTVSAISGAWNAAAPILRAIFGL
jgi:hypothetical protein